MVIEYKSYKLVIRKTYGFLQKTTKGEFSSCQWYPIHIRWIPDKMAPHKGRWFRIKLSPSKDFHF